jgi:hypothetical protein
VVIRILFVCAVYQLATTDRGKRILTPSVRTGLRMTVVVDTLRH